MTKTILIQVRLTEVQDEYVSIYRITKKLTTKAEAVAAIIEAARRK